MDLVILLATTTLSVAQTINGSGENEVLRVESSVSECGKPRVSSHGQTKAGGTMNSRANIRWTILLALTLIGFISNMALATDTVVGDGTPASCTQTALQTAVDGTGGQGTVTFDCGSTATIDVTSPISIASDVIIDGGGNKITIDGGDASRLFYATARLDLRWLTLQNGYANGDGGAIWTNAFLAITNSTLAHNHATGNGGAIWGGEETITLSTLTDNRADGNGGAIWFADYSLLRLNSSTVSGNSAGGWAGGIYINGYGSSLIWYDSIVAGNTANSYGDCFTSGTYYPPGGTYNLLGPDRCGLDNGGNGGFNVGNIVDIVNPKLGALADNGGPTPTMVPLPDSPAVDAANNTYPEDQRGFDRILPYDIGAAEFILNNPPVISPIGDKTVQATQLLTFTVAASDPDGDALVYSATNLPPRATFDPVTHLFRWQPTSKQTGSYRVTFTVTDDKTPPAGASETITITVPVNNAPALAQIPNFSVRVGQFVGFNVTATDPDAGDSITYSCTKLPAGAAFNATTGVFSWTPSKNGTYKVTFTATDNGIPAKSSAQTVTITVTK
jgi:hypothetical protein